MYIRICYWEFIFIFGDKEAIWMICDYHFYEKLDCAEQQSC